jgi:hypothetical protein
MLARGEGGASSRDLDVIESRPNREPTPGSFGVSLVDFEAGAPVAPLARSGVRLFSRDRVWLVM